MMSIVKRALVALVLLGAVLAVVDWLALAVGVHALLDAPNAGKAVAELADPPPPSDVVAQRFEVGSPPVSIATWRLDPAGGAPPLGTVFVLHGIRDAKTSMLGWGRALSAAGLRAVLVDHRGQGASTGDVMSYGVFESRDLSAIADQLAAAHLLAGRVGVLGFSYGAATAIAWAGHEPRVAAVVAVAPFSSVRSIMPGYAAAAVPFLGARIPATLLDRTLRLAGQSGGFDPIGDSPLSAMARIRVPVLLIHGSADRSVPLSESRALVARAPDRAQLLVADGEDHVGALRDGQHLVAGPGLDFLRRHLAAP